MVFYEWLPSIQIVAFWDGISRSTLPYITGVLRPPVARYAGLQYTGAKAATPRICNVADAPLHGLIAIGGRNGWVK